jgi:hypothetical protein
MVEPSRVPGDHNLFICSDSESAKKELITHLSAWFGSKPENIVDPGDITAARGTEMIPLWMRLFRARLVTRISIIRLSAVTDRHSNR